MRYLSVCSGIDAASVAWAPLGWRAVAFSEVEAFPSAVLAHRFPHVPNWGDMTKFQEWPDAEIDLLVGGTPCQSFSVAGMRQGLKDPRGNLTLTFLAIAEKYKPRFVVWENVPGVISDSTNALHAFLDGLEELGYIIDIDILDAQFFGLAQRRRRVFVCGQHRDDLLKTRTHSSALTIAQCLTEILHATLKEGSSKFASGGKSSDSLALSKDGARRRMKLFGLDADGGAWPKWQLHLEEANTRSSIGQENWGSDAGASPAASMRVVLSMGSTTDALSIRTEQSWSVCLDEALQVARSFITSTATKEITEREIFICSQALLNIGGLIARLNASQPCFWNAASSNLTAIKECIVYARSASCDLFTDLEWLQPWVDFVGEAERTANAIGDISLGNFGQILPLAQGLRGNPPPRREAGKGTAASVVSSLTASGRGVERTGETRGQDPVVAIASTGDVAHCLNAGGMGRQDYETETMIAHALRAEGLDASEDGTGRGTPIVPVAFSCKDHGADAQHGVAPTMRAMGHAESHANAGGQLAVAFDLRGREGGAMPEGPHETANIRAASGGSSRSYLAYAMQAGVTRENPASGPDGVGVQEGIAYTLEARAEVQAVASSWAVRRLMPVECEKLQGFPPGWTDVPYRGKPAADGPRYRALGNSFAVNVVRWIGMRIQMVEAICSSAKAAE